MRRAKEKGNEAQRVKPLTLTQTIGDPIGDEEQTGKKNMIEKETENFPFIPFKL